MTATTHDVGHVHGLEKHPGLGADALCTDLQCSVLRCAIGGKMIEGSI